MKTLILALLMGTLGCATGSVRIDGSVSADADLDTSVEDAGVDAPLDVSIDATDASGRCMSFADCDDGMACTMDDCVMGVCVSTMPYDTTSDVNHCGAACEECPAPAEFQVNMVRFCRDSACGLECTEGAMDVDMDPSNGCECAMGAGEDFPDVDGMDTDCDGVDGSVTLGVFVAQAPVGSPSGTGRIDAPFDTIEAGIAAAAAMPGRKEVYVAIGTYTGPLTLVDGVSLFGGYNPADWSRMPAMLTDVTGGVIALEAENIDSPTLVQRMRFTAEQPVTPGASSYGAHVTESEGLTFEATELIAGAGANGTAGSSGGMGASGSVGRPGGNGCDGCSGAGLSGAGGASPCGSRGGAGGRGAYGNQRGGTGSVGLGPAPGTGGIGGSGDGSNCVFGCSRGGVGTMGNASPRVGVAGAHATTVGMLVIDASGVSAGDGVDGSMGSRGSGGGGGGGGGGSDCCNDDRGGGGGGGGGGGCGGGGGGGGMAGGSSVALFSFNSSVELIDCSLMTAAGGRGGAGSAGGAGGNGAGGGGGGGPADDGGPGARGGFGSAGGRGGSGGGGNGGHSLCLVAGGGGTRPDTFECSPGAGGVGGIGNGLAVNGANGMVGRAL